MLAGHDPLASPAKIARSPVRSPPRSPPTSRSELRQPAEPISPRSGTVRVRVLGVERDKASVWLKMDAQATISTYQSSTIRPFSRSVADFALLHGALAASRPQTIVPAVPPVQTSAATDEEEDRLVRASFQRWIDRVTRNPDLVHDDELRTFIESHFGYSPQTQPRRHKATSSLSKLRGGGHEGDDPLGATKLDYGKLETTLADLARAADKEARQRRAHATTMHELSDQLVAFATTEAHAPLADGLRRLAAGSRRLGDLEHAIATAESVALGDGSAYASSECKEATDALSQRQSILDEHQNAARMTIAKKRAIERLRASSSIKADRADDALEEYEEAKKYEDMLGRRIAAVSGQLAPAVEAHTSDLHLELLSSLLHHARAGLAHERLVQRDLLSLRPELLAIPSRQAGDLYIVQPRPSATSVPASHPPLSVRTEAQRTIARDDTSHIRRGSLGDQKPEQWPAMYSPPSSPSRPAYGSRSEVVPSAHARQASSGNGRINELARSVIITKPTVDAAPRPRDERQRVDARAAASRLANFL